MDSPNSITAPDNLWPIARTVFQYFEGELIQGAFVLYLVILVSAIITYKLGFAKKLPLLKSAVVYLVLVIGCIFLTVPLGLTLPIAEGLLGSAAFLGIYRFRLHRERGKQEKTSI